MKNHAAFSPSALQATKVPPCFQPVRTITCPLLPFGRGLLLLLQLILLLLPLLLLASLAPGLVLLLSLLVFEHFIEQRTGER